MPSQAVSSAAGVVVSLVSTHALADEATPIDEDRLQSIEVTGTAIHTTQDISQSTDTVSK
jgi:hypothetical protein